MAISLMGDDVVRVVRLKIFHVAVLNGEIAEKFFVINHLATHIS